jgi:hypothetical protein
MTSPSVLLTALAQCLCEALSDDDYHYPIPCFCGVIPGTQVIEEMSSGCSDQRNGIAWVRLVSTYPSVSVGQQDTRLGNCGVGLGMDVEVGLVREHSAYYEGDALTVEEMASQAVWQHDDMLAVRRAIVCCEALEDFILGPYQPYGQGGLIGGAWIVHVGL